jgi:hypothetical protein
LPSKQINVILHQSTVLNRVREEITLKKGALYDPAVVDACLKLFSEKGFKLE